MFKLLKHQCIFHISGAELLCPALRSEMLCTALAPDRLGPMALCACKGLLGTVWGPARAGDSVGTGVVDKLVAAAMVSLLACPRNLDQG